jgi:hypothetical protein
MLSTSPRFIGRGPLTRVRRLGLMTPLASSISSWILRSIKPPPTRICGSNGGPPITANRVRLRDGRHLAYHESGAKKSDARFKIVFSHGFTGSRFDSIRASPVRFNFQTFSKYFVFYRRKNREKMTVLGCSGI